MEKQNLTQQKHTHANQKKCTTQDKHKKTKARSSRLVRHQDWKRRGRILTYIPKPTQGHKDGEMED